MFSLSIYSKCIHCLTFNTKSNRYYHFSKLNFLLTLEKFSILKKNLNNKYFERFLSSNNLNTSNKYNHNKMQQNNNNNNNDEIQTIDLDSQFQSDFLSLTCNPSTGPQNRNIQGQQENSQAANSNTRLDFTEEGNNKLIF